MYFLFILVYMSVSIPHACSTHRGQRRAPCPRELELQVVVTYPTWVPGTRLRSLEEQEALLTTESSPPKTVKLLFYSSIHSSICAPGLCPPTVSDLSVPLRQLHTNGPPPHLALLHPEPLLGTLSRGDTVSCGDVWNGGRLQRHQQHKSGDEQL